MALGVGGCIAAGEQPSEQGSVLHAISVLSRSLQTLSSFHVFARGPP